MQKDTTRSFVVELRLRTFLEDETAIDNSLNAGRMVFNACLGETLRRLDLMRESKAYKRTAAMAKDESRTKAFKALRQKYGFKDSAIQAFAIECKNAAPQIGNHIDAHSPQKIATRVFAACNRYAVGLGGRPRFKGRHQFNSLECKTNAAGIRYRDGWVMWRGLEIECIINPKDEVVAYGLTRRIKFCRFVKRVIKGKVKYYAQLVVEGIPWQKERNKPGEEVVGIDIGPSTIAYVGETKADLKQFCAELENIERQIRLMQREMDRSRRGANLQNYKCDGTIKKGGRKWEYSERYKVIRAELADLHRRSAAHRHSLHGKLGNDILRVGNQLHIENSSFKSFQKNFGKSVGNRAPGMFVTGLVRKAESAGGTAWDIPSHAFKMSQLCKCGKCKKKPLSERWHKCDCGAVVQRDLMSAFLARCVEKKDDKYMLDMSRVERLWCETEPLMKQAISRILDESASGRAFPASFGLKSLRSAQRQSGSPVNLMLRSEPGERTVVNTGDAVTVSTCGKMHCESSGKAAVTIRRTPRL